MVSAVLVDMDAVNLMVAYRPVVQACGEPHGCKTGRYAAITVTESISTSTVKSISVVLAEHRTAP
jgi:hypothetical protein